MSDWRDTIGSRIGAHRTDALTAVLEDLITVVGDAPAWSRVTVSEAGFLINVISGQVLHVIRGRRDAPAYPAPPDGLRSSCVYYARRIGPDARFDLEVVCTSPGAETPSVPQTDVRTWKFNLGSDTKDFEIVAPTPDADEDDAEHLNAFARALARAILVAQDES